MEIKSRQEWTFYTRDEIEELFGLKGAALSETVKALRELNILKCRPISSAPELGILADESKLISFNSNNTYGYVFQYVGILKIRDCCLLIYPKYLRQETYINDQADNYRLLKLILSVIEKYNARCQNQAYDISEEDTYQNQLVIAIELIKDFMQNGLYETAQNVVEINGEGQILWNDTISKSDAYIVENTPIYLDWFTLNQENNIYNFFHRLHRIILTQVSIKYRDILDILNIPPISLSDESIESLGDIDYLINRINQELSIQFRTSKQHILNLMKRYLLDAESNSESNDISFVGSNAFNLIWEDVCSIIKNNVLNKNLAELNKTYKEFDPYKTTLRNIISRPIWEEYETGVKDSTNTLIPDIVAFEDDNLVIYDAKYYNTHFINYKIKNVPGIESLTKQILYELAYREFAKENSMKIAKNSYLMPYDGENDYILGSGRFDILKNYTWGSINDVTIEMVAANKAFLKYIKY
ncbi:LlaJI family restriction endonuclease [Veillonella caviae]|uniref:LlaJI family restriction endonuclease n=1 Tax=Veillonella caviae TaxID=248316 RepID=UPI0023F964FF|nr:LlaJI family restriction endonuclease [Veillonella caviae]